MASPRVPSPRPPRPPLSARPASGQSWRQGRGRNLGLGSRTGQVDEGVADVLAALAYTGCVGEFSPGGSVAAWSLGGASGSVPAPWPPSGRTSPGGGRTSPPPPVSRPASAPASASISALSSAAAAALWTAENVQGCLEAALLKLQNNHGWSLVDSSFAHRTLPAVIDAAKAQLQAAEQRRQELLDESEHLRAFVERKDDELAELRQWTEEQAWYPRKEAHKSEVRLKQAQERSGILNARMSAASSELQHLQGTVGEALNSEREAFQRKRAEMVSERDRRAREVKERKERLDRERERFHMLQIQVNATAQELSHATFEAQCLPDTEAKLRGLQVDWGDMQTQLEIAKSVKKKRKPQKA
mmetsp:Transcript_90230/g.291740  ORF Transcript_90230/g.291740 Transcript_90230/m.291740 type:complete len:358 (-) Transcript_90230:112-1185(-)